MLRGGGGGRRGTRGETARLRHVISEAWRSRVGVVMPRSQVAAVARRPWEGKLFHVACRVRWSLLECLVGGVGAPRCRPARQRNGCPIITLGRLLLWGGAMQATMGNGRTVAHRDGRCTSPASGQRMSECDGRTSWPLLCKPVRGGSAPFVCHWVLFSVYVLVFTWYECFCMFALEPPSHANMCLCAHPA